MEIQSILQLIIQQKLLISLIMLWSKNINQVVIRLMILNRIAPADGNFQLIAGFPPKPLDKPYATIEEADLLDSTVTQKLI